MVRRLHIAAAVLALAVTATAQAQAQDGKNVGGAPMLSAKNIVENAVNSKDHTTLVAAVKTAGLVETLSGPGPFTVFAPTNAAFEKLPKGTVEKLLEPDMKDQLSAVLTYHVVPGKLTAKALMDQVAKSGGKATLSTAQGGKLTVSQKDRDQLVVTDAKGSMSIITIADVMQSNGVIHVVNTVLLPQ